MLEPWTPKVNPAPAFEGFFCYGRGIVFLEPGAPKVVVDPDPPHSPWRIPVGHFVAPFWELFYVFHQDLLDEQLDKLLKGEREGSIDSIFFLTTTGEALVQTESLTWTAVESGYQPSEEYLEALSEFCTNTAGFSADGETLVVLDEGTE